MRGPMLHQIIRQFLQQVEWGELDYLIVDLPPGTGDVVISLVQTVPLTGAVVVSTPSDVSPARCAQGSGDVRPGQCGSAGHRGKHEPLYLSALPPGD
jgi:ubiquinone/menaquinone biosynthesis C-methylase UbiE